MSHILVIEDELAVRENIIDLLEAEDYDVSATHNGFRGLMWASEHIPDLIISDVMMPEIDGHDILRALRQNPITAAIPFVFLTALSTKHDIRFGMNLGADDYLTKPYVRTDLLNAVASRIKKNQQLSLLKAADFQSKEVSSIPAIVLKHQFDKAEPKLQIAIHMLKDLAVGERRNQCIEILRQNCAEEIALLDQIPNIGDFFPIEEVNLLRQLMQNAPEISP
jgi:two-component system, OmpR family, alkaline phosphatase synthesis response regulator PhoP